MQARGGKSSLALPLDRPLPGLAGLACVDGGPMGGDLLGRAWAVKNRVPHDACVEKAKCTTRTNL